jgi:ABC-2 type transport system permease protein
MKGMYAVYRKEMGHYFVSPVAYVVVGVFLILAGYFFNQRLIQILQEVLQSDVTTSQFGSQQPIDVPAVVLRNFFSILSTLLLFLTPMLTMAVYSEERRRGTMELLLTSPVSETEIVLGKFFASMTLLVIMLVPTVFYFVFMFLHTDPAATWRTLPGAYLGALLLGGMLLSLGSFFSSLTESQLIAAILSFGAILVLWVMDLSSQAQSGALSQALRYLAFYHHYDDFTRGIVDTSDVIFYLSFMVLSIFLTVRSLDSIRWRRA